MYSCDSPGRDPQQIEQEPDYDLSTFGWFDTNWDPPYDCPIAPDCGNLQLSDDMYGHCMGKESCEFTYEMITDPEHQVCGHIPNWMEVKYNCIPFPDTASPHLNICTQQGLTYETYHAYIVSPGFPSGYDGIQNRNCSCHVTPQGFFSGNTFELTVYTLNLPGASDYR